MPFLSIVVSVSLYLSLHDDGDARMQCGPAHPANGNVNVKGNVDANGSGNGNGEEDVVLFVGSGTTAAVVKLVSALGLDRKKSRFSRSNNT